jgi:hypothetical protein
VDARFWQELVPQLAQTYNFVWDSVVCLSSLLEHVTYKPLSTASDSSDSTEVMNRQHQQALGFYNRAISNLRQLAARDQVDDSIVVLSYILFSSVEFQQRQVKTGIELLKRCCDISIKNLASTYPRRNSTATHAVDQVVTPFVLRKAVLTATLGCALPLQWPANEEANDILRAALSRSPILREARVQFYSLVDDSYNLIRLADFLPHIEDSQPVKVSFMTDRQSVLDKLTHWKASFNPTSSPTPDAEIDWIASYLLMYWTVCYVSLATCVSTRQTVFDDHMDRFAEIVEYARVYLKHCTEFPRIRLLASADPGLVPPMYFCATKCRDPVLRREAQHMMRLAPQQGSQWAFVEPDRVLSRLISLEEGANRPPSSKASLELEHAGLPPEERRFAFVSMVGHRAPGGKQRQALELNRFEFTADGSRRLISEYAWLDDGDEVGPDAQQETPAMIM